MTIGMANKSGTGSRCFPVWLGYWDHARVPVPLLLGPRRKRRGLSLLEVILAIAILGGSIAVIGELIRTGARQAEEAREMTNAQLLCESKMEEIAAGVVAPESTSLVPFDENPNWTYTTEVTPLDTPDLIEVRITVQQAENNRLVPLTYTLTRWMIDPEVELELMMLAAQLESEAMMGSAAMSEGDEAEEDSSSTSSGGSTGGSSSGGTGNTAGGGGSAIGGGGFGGGGGQGGGRPGGGGGQGGGRPDGGDPGGGRPGGGNGGAGGRPGGGTPGGGAGGGNPGAS